MRILLLRSKILILSLTLALAQFACSFGAQNSNSSAPSSGAATQPSSPTGAPQPTPAPAATKSERGTPAEAQAMLKLAVDHYNSVGRDQALKDFTAGSTPFLDRDLYVVCLGSGGVITASGGFPQYVGLSADVIKDSAGKPVGTTIWTKGSTDGQGSIQFNWINPVSGKTEPKIFFFQKVGTEVCGVGAYNP
ncbi:MAG TPA: cache domain-containing protein [Anaerolineales bacterium]|nr:cache domain-containing protein [Anaerolineales bacterium]